MADRVQPLKFESTGAGGSSDDLFPQPLNPNEDAIEAAGFYPQNATSRDMAAGMERDAAGKLVFKDASSGSVLLETLKAAEANAASNIGTGTGDVYASKSGSTLQFRKLKSANNAVSITNSSNDVLVTFNAANVSHQSLSGAGTKTHSDIDNHIAGTAQSHAIGHITGLQTVLDGKVTIHDSALPYTADVIVYGDSDKYYPVIISRGNQNLLRTIKIWRTYSERGPDDWNTSTHRGSLMLHWMGNFGGWGGAVYSEMIYENTSAYTTLLANCFRHDYSMSYCFMLRGGGPGGAAYHFASDQPIQSMDPSANNAVVPGASIYYNGALDLTYASATQPMYAPEPVTVINKARLDGMRVARLGDVPTKADTFLGSVGNVSVEPQITTPEKWADFPVGYARLQTSSTGTAGGAPGASYGYFTKIANRDNNGGWGGLWLGLTAGQNYIGRTASRSSYAAWEKIWTDANMGTGSGLDADLLDGKHASDFAPSNYVPAGMIKGAVNVGDTNNAAQLVKGVNGSNLEIRTIQAVGTNPVKFVTDNTTGEVELQWDPTQITHNSLSGRSTADAHPATAITEDSTHRFVTNTQISSWDAKLSAVPAGYATESWVTAGFQPKGNYQPAGSYQPAGNYLTDVATPSTTAASGTTTVASPRVSLVGTTVNFRKMVAKKGTATAAPLTVAENGNDLDITINVGTGANQVAAGNHTHATYLTSLAHSHTITGGAGLSDSGNPVGVDGTVTLAVELAANSGLKFDAAGNAGKLLVDFGTGSNQVAAGNHGHSDLAPKSSPTLTGNTTVDNLYVQNVYAVYMQPYSGAGYFSIVDLFAEKLHSHENLETPDHSGQTTNGPEDYYQYWGANRVHFELFKSATRNDLPPGSVDYAQVLTFDPYDGADKGYTHQLGFSDNGKGVFYRHGVKELGNTGRNGTWSNWEPIGGTPKKLQDNTAISPPLGVTSYIPTYGPNLFVYEVVEGSNSEVDHTGGEAGLITIDPHSSATAGHNFQLLFPSDGGNTFYFRRGDKRSSPPKWEKWSKVFTSDNLTAGELPTHTHYRLEATNRYYSSPDPAPSTFQSDGGSLQAFRDQSSTIGVPSAINTSSVLQWTAGNVAFDGGGTAVVAQLATGGPTGYDLYFRGGNASSWQAWKKVAVDGDYQPLDADLTSIAGLTGTSGLLRKTASNTWTLDTNSYSTTAHTHSNYATTGHTHASSEINGASGQTVAAEISSLRAGSFAAVPYTSAPNTTTALPYRTISFDYALYSGISSQYQDHGYYPAILTIGAYSNYIHARQQQIAFGNDAIYHRGSDANGGNWGEWGRLDGRQAKVIFQVYNEGTVNASATTTKANKTEFGYTKVSLTGYRQVRVMAKNGFKEIAAATAYWSVAFIPDGGSVWYSNDAGTDQVSSSSNVAWVDTGWQDIPTSVNSDSVMVYPAVRASTTTNIRLRAMTVMVR